MEQSERENAAYCVRQILFVPPAPLVWAEGCGFFTKAGVEVATTQTMSSDQIGKSLAAGEFDVGIGVMDNAIAWNELYLADLCIIAQLEQRMLMRFVAQASITSLAEAAEKPIAVDATSNGFVLVLYRALAQNGIDWRRCVFEEIGGVKQRFEAMIGGKANSTILVPPFDDMAISKGCNALWGVDDVAPAYPGVVITARRDFLRDHRAAAKSYLGALLQAIHWATDEKNREAAKAALIASRYSEKSAEILVRDTVPGLRPSLDGWAETINLRRECSLMPAGWVDNVIDGTLLVEAEAALHDAGHL